MWNEWGEGEVCVGPLIGGTSLRRTNEIHTRLRKSGGFRRIREKIAIVKKIHFSMSV